MPGRCAVLLRTLKRLNYYVAPNVSVFLVMPLNGS